MDEKLRKKNIFLLNIIPKYPWFSLIFYDKQTYYQIENDEKNGGILDELNSTKKKGKGEK